MNARLVIWPAFLVIILQTAHSQPIDELIAKASRYEPVGVTNLDPNHVLVELDIKFTREQWNDILEMLKSEREERVKRKAIRSLRKRWRNRTVVYDFAEDTFSGYDKRQINKAIRDWKKYTCVEFKRATHLDKNRVLFENGKGCSSYIGMIGGLQHLTLAPGCRKKGIILHELGHAMGFFHEQTRPDRDQFVKVLSDNIKHKATNNFRRYNKLIINTYNVPYDYGSIMHYGPYYFSKNGRPTIMTRDPEMQNVIGNRKGLSFQDIHLANLMYNCSERCKPGKRCPSDGFLAKDCRCWCPGNPVRLCDGGSGGKPTPAPRPTTTGPIAPPSGRRDKSPLCKYFTRPCRSIYSKALCPITCGFAECTDRHKFCRRYAAAGLCRDTTRICRLSCGNC